MRPGPGQPQAQCRARAGPVETRARARGSKPLLSPKFARPPVCLYVTVIMIEQHNAVHTGIFFRSSVLTLRPSFNVFHPLSFVRASVQHCTWPPYFSQV